MDVQQKLVIACHSLFSLLILLVHDVCWSKILHDKIMVHGKADSTKAATMIARWSRSSQIHVLRLLYVKLYTWEQGDLVEYKSRHVVS